ncbi:MAG: hypothetical protein ACM3KR_02290 [Deltaproteobacteria bacterium]
MDGKKAVLLLFLITQLNRPISVDAQEPSNEQKKLLKDSFSGDFEFKDNSDEMLLAQADTEGMLLASCTDCCRCDCKHCDCQCQCQCQCVQHCDNPSDSAHNKQKYHFYDFISNNNNLTINRPNIFDGHYTNDFYFNSRMNEKGSAYNYSSIEYTVYTPIFNYYSSDTTHNPNGQGGAYTNINPKSTSTPFKLTGNYSDPSAAISGNTNAADTVSATYDDEHNTVIFYTSRYTKAVRVKIHGDKKDAVIDLVRDPVSNPDVFENNLKDDSAKAYMNGTTTVVNDTNIPELKDVTCDVAPVTPSGGNPGDLVEWTFKFKLRTYGLFSQPGPNVETQLGTFSIEDAWDFNNVSCKTKQVPAGLPSSIKEDIPAKIDFLVRQPRLYNFRIMKVDDIYWKYVPKNMGVDKMPLKTAKEAKNRHISLGYLLEFSIDSSDFDGSAFSSVEITPSFYCGNLVDVKYDEPSKKLYNLPLTNKYTQISVPRGQIIDKIPGTEIVSKESLRMSRDNKKEEIRWKFIYYLPPTAKAFLNNKQQRGLLGIKFDITGPLVGLNGKDTTLQSTLPADNKIYDFTNKNKNDGGLGGGGVFYYNLDWNALDDYSSQQK